MPIKLASPLLFLLRVATSLSLPRLFLLLASLPAWKKPTDQADPVPKVSNERRHTGLFFIGCTMDDIQSKWFWKWKCPVRHSVGSPTTLLTRIPSGFKSDLPLLRAWGRTPLKSGMILLRTLYGFSAANKTRQKTGVESTPKILAQRCLCMAVSMAPPLLLLILLLLPLETPHPLPFWLLLWPTVLPVRNKPHKLSPKSVHQRVTLDGQDVLQVQLA